MHHSLHASLPATAQTFISQTSMPNTSLQVTTAQVPEPCMQTVHTWLKTAAAALLAHVYTCSMHNEAHTAPSFCTTSNHAFMHGITSLHYFTGSRTTKQIPRCTAESPLHFYQCADGVGRPLRLLTTLASAPNAVIHCNAVHQEVLQLVEHCSDTSVPPKHKKPNHHNSAPQHARAYNHTQCFGYTPVIPNAGCTRTQSR
jgi:hypothetical protein